MARPVPLTFIPRLLVSIQLGCMAALAVICVVYWPPPLAAVVLWTVAAVIALPALVALGSSFRVSPIPNRQGLKTSGIYSLIRHPMYLAVILFTIGAIFVNYVALLPAGLLLGVLNAKMEIEERLLARTYPGYEQYQRKTKRLIPFVW
jgi:protein-S-isoprenylcysteine O-methyltransferase Ste14